VSQTQAPARKGGYHHNDLRTALQDVAVRLIAERGGPDFSLRELGAEIGVSHTAVYRHFADKDALLDVLMERGFAELHRCQKRELEKAGTDPLERLYALDEAYIRFAREHTGAFWLMFGNRGDAASRAKARPGINQDAYRTLIDTICECQRAGIIVAGDPQTIAGYLIMATHGYACYSAQDREMVGLSEQLMSPRKLAEISLIPVLATPPSPHEVQSRYFAAP
jgi:AcrR family transcriptional regulator